MPSVPVGENERVVETRDLPGPGEVLVSSAAGRWVEHDGQLHRIEPDHVKQAEEPA